MGRGYSGGVVDASTECSTPSGVERIRVFLLDDHEIVRRGIKELLEGEPDIVVVGESGLAEGGSPPDPGASPGRGILGKEQLLAESVIDVCRDIRSRDPRSRIRCFLTSCDADSALLVDGHGPVQRATRSSRYGGGDLDGIVRRVAAGQSASTRRHRPSSTRSVGPPSTWSLSGAP